MRIANNAQEYYDILVKTSLEGGFPSLGESRRARCQCAYRGRDGRCCGVGVIMPDNFYREEFDCPNDPMTVKDISEYDGFEDWLPEGVTLGDLNAVQIAHDDNPNGTWDHQYFLKKLRGIPCFFKVSAATAA